MITNLSRKSFGYIDNLSIINVTNADRNGGQAAGSYVTVIYANGEGNVTIEDIRDVPPDIGSSFP